MTRYLRPEDLRLVREWPTSHPQIEAYRRWARGTTPVPEHPFTPEELAWFRGPVREGDQ